MSQKPRLWSPAVRPSGIHRVGDYLRVSWAHMNIETDALRDVYLDLRVPASLAVIPRETRVGGTSRRERSLEDHEREQITLGDIAVGESVWVDIAVRAIAPSADTDSVAIAVRSAGAEVGTSKAVPVQVRGTAAITVGDPKVVSQKAEENRFAALYTFTNTGTKTANDVVLRVPAPAGFRISRMMLETPTDGVTDNEHDFVRELYFPSVEPEREERVGLEFVATPDALGDSVELAGAVVSFQGGETVVPATSLRLSPHVDFSRSHLAMDATSVTAGQILRVRLNVANVGRSDARDVPVAFVLPDELIYASGTLSINGGADARHNDLGNIVLPMVRGRSIAEVAFNASVRAPLEHGTRMAIQARVDDIDVDAVDVDVESHAYFPLSENYVELDEPTSIYADLPRTLIVRMHNAGTDVGEAVRLRLTVSDLSIDRVEIVEGDGRTSNAGVATIGGTDVSSMVDIGTIPPGETRRAKVVVRAPEAFPNNTFFEVRGFLRVGEDEEIEIGGANLHGCSAPRIDPERSEIRAMRDDEFRIGQMRSVMIRLENTGSADAEDVTVDLDLPATIALRGDDGELVDSHHVGFARVPAWGIAEKTVKLELVAAPEREPTGGIEIHPIVSCPGTSSFRLRALRLLTTSRAIIDNVRTEIRDVENNEALVTFRATNSGDRAARNVIISLVDNAPAYVAESTTFSATFYDRKTFALRDCAGTTVLTKGFIIPEFAAGETLSLSFKVDLTSLEEFTVGFSIDCDALTPAQPELKRYRKMHQRRALVGDIDDLVLSGPRIVGSTMVPRALQIERTVLSARIPVALPGGKDDSNQAPQPNAEAGPPISEQAVALEAAGATHGVASIDEPLESAAVVADIEQTLEPTRHESEPAPSAAAQDDVSAGGAAPDAAAETSPATPMADTAAEQNGATDEAATASTSTELTADGSTSNANGHSVGSVTITVVPDSPQNAAAPAAMELQGAFGIMQLNEARLRKIAHFLEVLSGKEDDLGMYRHLLAMRLFLPDGIHGVSKEDSLAYAGVIQPLAVVKQTKMLAFVATKSFTIAPTMVDAFEGNDVADAALVLRNIADRVSRRSFNATVDANHGYLVSTFGTSYLAEYRNERPGGGHFHRMLAELLPNISADYPQIGEELANYRKMLVDELDQFVYQAPLPRYESLRRAGTANLDGALSRVGRAFGAREFAHD